MALPQQNRLRSNRDFSRVHSKGKRAATRHLAIRALKPRSINRSSSSITGSRSLDRAPVGMPAAPLTKETAKKTDRPVKSQSASGEPFALLSCEKKGPVAIAGPRFGISISRKVSKRAVVRNRIKRQLKAIIREHFIDIDPAWQIVIVVRPPAVECSFDKFLRELEYLLQKLAIVSSASSTNAPTVNPRPVRSRSADPAKSDQ